MAERIIIRTECSGCWANVRVNRDTAVVTSRVPSNGKRGSLHVPAHDVTSDVLNDDGDLVTWDCPVCEYADSFDLNS